MVQYNEALITMYSGYHPDLYLDKSNYSKPQDGQCKNKLVKCVPIDSSDKISKDDKMTEDILQVFFYRN